MRKEAKIAIIIVVCIAVIAGVVYGLFASGMFSQSSYSKLKFDDYITLAEYKGLTYVEEEQTVTDKEVETEIQNRLEAAATSDKVKTGTVKKGDTITINYVGRIDGETFDGGTASNSTITVGSAGFIDGFEDGLIGKKVGSETVLKLKFPDDYQNADVAGKDVEFTVTIVSKTVVTVPDLNEEFVKANSDCKTVDEYKETVKKDLLKSKEEAAKQVIKQQLWSKIVEKTEVKDYPTEELEYENGVITAQYTEQASQYGMTLEEYLKQAGKISLDDFKNDAATYAKSVCSQKMILYAIAKKENLKITNKEFKEKLNEMLKSAGFTEEMFKNQYGMSIEEYAEKNDLRTSYLMDKVMDRILELGTVTDDVKNADAQGSYAEKEAEKTDADAAKTDSADETKDADAAKDTDAAKEEAEK